MKSMIVIPARYQSTRLPGKPLAKINGQTMLARVVKISTTAAAAHDNVSVVVATDDERILNHCIELGVPSLLTAPEIPTGTDRVAEAVRISGENPDFILNMQGDSPLTPPDFLSKMIDEFQKEPCDVITSVTQLSWSELDKLRQSKLTTPFSGTTAVFNQETGRAYWFSKQIIPTLRKEHEMREQNNKSPIYRHIGIYGYSRAMLDKYSSLHESRYEKMEGLEQLRLLERGYHIRCVPVDFQGRANMSGVDSSEDLARAETLIKQHGELLEN